MRFRKFYFVIFLSIFFLVFAGFNSLAQNSEKNLEQKLTIDQLIDFQEFSSYQESPSLQKLVESGDLPPVKERLPKEPLVWKKDMMVDGIGTYGGVWRDTFGVAPTGYNWAAGQTQGYYGINQMIQETLITTGPMWMLESPDPVPHLAKSWEWSEDGKTLTMHLVEGVKWSDGVEFTAEDVLFTYQDNILDDNVPSLQGSGPWTYNGKITELEKIDKYTIAWHFGESYPVNVFFSMDYPDLSIAPAHIYKNYHPQYNEEKTYDDYINATPPENLPAVVLGPYVPVAYEADEMMILSRNPYYWQVDEEGQQLPYIDEVKFLEARTMETRTVNALGGSTDRSHIHSPKLFSLALKTEQEPDSHFKLQWTDYYNCFELQLNYSLYASVEDERDKELRKLFRKKDFRKALSHGIDREGIAEAVFPGEATKPFYGGYPEASNYYDEDSLTKYPYNPEEARNILKKIGFEMGEDEIFDWPQDSEMAGQNLVIEALVSSNVTTIQQIGELLVPQFREIGIELKLTMLKSSVMQGRINSGDFEINIARTNAKVTPWANPELIGPRGPYTPDWHIEDPEQGRDLISFEKEIQELLDKTVTMTNADERKEIFSQIQKIYTENIYTIGIYQKADLLLVAKRFKNIPEDAVMYRWQWTPTSNPIQTFWTPESEQIQPEFLDQIPGSQTYQSQDWYKNLNISK